MCPECIFCSQRPNYVFTFVTLYINHLPVHTQLDLQEVGAALSITLLMSSAQVMILITGAHKAFALYKAIEEGVNHMWTVSAFQQHPRTIFVCDEDATLELRVKTVKYFKGTECYTIGYKWGWLNINNISELQSQFNSMAVKGKQQHPKLELSWINTYQNQCHQNLNISTFMEVEVFAELCWFQLGGPNFFFIYIYIYTHIGNINI